MTRRRKPARATILDRVIALEERMASIETIGKRIAGALSIVAANLWPAGEELKRAAHGITQTMNPPPTPPAAGVVGTLGHSRRFSQADLRRLRRALKTGNRSVTFADQTVTFGSFEELDRLVRLLQARGRRLRNKLTRGLPRRRKARS